MEESSRGTRGRSCHGAPRRPWSEHNGWRGGGHEEDDLVEEDTCGQIRFPFFRGNGLHTTLAVIELKPGWDLIPALSDYARSKQTKSNVVSYCCKLITLQSNEANTSLGAGPCRHDDQS